MVKACDPHIHHDPRAAPRARARRAGRRKGCVRLAWGRVARPAPRCQRGDCLLNLVLVPSWRLSPEPVPAQVEAASYMEDLRGFVFDESKCVTYKWLSTTLEVSADVSKRMLYEFCEANSEKISATYLVSGVSAEGDRHRRFQLVGAEKLKSLHEMGFAEVQAAHVFSVAPRPEVDGLTSPCSKSSALWSSEYDANRELYKAEPAFSNCLRDNRHGHVKCAKVTRDLRPRQLFPHSPMPTAPGAGAASAAAPASALSSSRTSFPKTEVGRFCGRWLPAGH